MTKETKKALLSMVRMFAKKGYREISPGWPVVQGTPVISLEDCFDHLIEAGIPEKEIQKTFDAAAVAAGR